MINNWQSQIPTNSSPDNHQQQQSHQQKRTNTNNNSNKMNNNNNNSLHFTIEELESYSSDTLLKLVQREEGNKGICNAIRSSDGRCAEVVADKLYPNLVQVIRKTGCYVPQVLLDRFILSRRDRIQEMVDIILADRSLILDLIYDSRPVTRHFLEKIIFNFDHDFAEDIIIEKFQDMVYHEAACHIAQYSIVNVTKPETRGKMLRCIGDNLLSFISHPIANYIITKVLNHLPPKLTIPLVTGPIKGKLVQLSCNKFASNVIQTLIGVADEYQTLMLKEKEQQPTQFLPMNLLATNHVNNTNNSNNDGDVVVGGGAGAGDDTMSTGSSQPPSMSGSTTDELTVQMLIGNHQSVSTGTSPTTSASQQRQQKPGESPSAGEDFIQNKKTTKPSTAASLSTLSNTNHLHEMVIEFFESPEPLLHDAAEDRFGNFVLQSFIKECSDIADLQFMQRKMAPIWPKMRYGEKMRHLVEANIRARCEAQSLNNNNNNINTSNGTNVSSSSGRSGGAAVGATTGSIFLDSNKRNSTTKSLFHARHSGANPPPSATCVNLSGQSNNSNNNNNTNSSNNNNNNNINPLITISNTGGRNIVRANSGRFDSKNSSTSNATGIIFHNAGSVTPPTVSPTASSAQQQQQQHQNQKFAGSNLMAFSSYAPTNASSSLSAASSFNNNNINTNLSANTINMSLPSTTSTAGHSFNSNMSGVVMPIVAGTSFVGNNNNNVNYSNSSQQQQPQQQQQQQQQQLVPVSVIGPNGQAQIMMLPVMQAPTTTTTTAQNPIQHQQFFQPQQQQQQQQPQFVIPSNNNNNNNFTNSAPPQQQQWQQQIQQTIPVNNNTNNNNNITSTVTGLPQPRLIGTLVQWLGDRNFGFAVVPGYEKHFFVHSKDFIYTANQNNRVVIPPVGCQLEFTPSLDSSAGNSSSADKQRAILVTQPNGVPLF